MKKQIIKTHYVNKTYLLPLYNYSTFWNNVKTIDNKQVFVTDKGNFDILSIEFTENNSFKIVTSELVETRKEFVTIKKDFTPKQYNNIESFINDTYKPLSIGIINKMYSGLRRKKDGSYIPHCNYGAVKDIINNHYNDNIMDDIYTICYMTLWINRDNITCENGYYNIGALTTDKEYIYYNEKTQENEVLKNCNSCYLACYKAISKWLYNQATKHEKRNIVSIEIENNDNEFVVDSMAFKQGLLNHTLSNSDDSKKVVKRVNETIKEVLEIVRYTEKYHIYQKCYDVMYLMTKGYNQKTIAEKLNMSDTSIRKYQNILCHVYHVLNDKKYSYDNNDKVIAYLQSRDNELKAYTENAKIFIDFTCVNGIIEHNNNNNVMELVNKYHHDKKQAMYNEIFHALPYDNNSMIVRNKMIETFYRKELQLDRNF